MTNALIHLTAMAGRLGLPIDPDELNALSETTPVLVELKPTGAHYMEDLHASGGLPAVLHELRDLLDLLDLSALTVTGETLGERLGDGPTWVDREVVRPLSEPSRKKGGLVWLRGSLAPSGALIKGPRLIRRCSRRLVVLWCSTRWRTWLRALTTRTWMCTHPTYWCCRTRVH